MATGLGLAQGTEAALFFLAWATWLLSELVGTIIIPLLRQSGAVESRRADRGSRFVIFLGLFVTLAAVSTFAALGLATLPLWVRYLGIGLVFAGIGVRQWAIAVLGRYFSTSVRVLEDHRIVTTGPYRYVRHPSYTGALLSLFGLGLAGGSWEGTIVIVVASAVVFAYRIHVEERLLREALGADYEAYLSRTKRLIPFVI